MLLNTTMMDHAHMHTIICIICHVSYALSVAILAQDSRVGYKHKIFALSCAQTSVVIRICVNVRLTDGCHWLTLRQALHLLAHGTRMSVGPTLLHAWHLRRRLSAFTSLFYSSPRCHLYRVWRCARSLSLLAARAWSLLSLRHSTRRCDKHKHCHFHNDRVLCWPALCLLSSDTTLVAKKEGDFPY